MSVAQAYKPVVYAYRVNFIAAQTMQSPAPRSASEILIHFTICVQPFFVVNKCPPQKSQGNVHSLQQWRHRNARGQGAALVQQRLQF